jgi:hypothetical protein
LPPGGSAGMRADQLLGSAASLLTPAVRRAFVKWDVRPYQRSSPCTNVERSTNLLFSQFAVIQPVLRLKVQHKDSAKTLPVTPACVPSDIRIRKAAGLG